MHTMHIKEINKTAHMLVDTLNLPGFSVNIPSWMVNISMDH